MGVLDYKRGNLIESTVTDNLITDYLDECCL